MIKDSLNIFNRFIFWDEKKPELIAFLFGHLKSGT
jgi:hypothetical protein